MGTNKAQLRIDSRTMLEQTLATLQLCFRDTTVIDKDDDPGHGPLGGIVTALRRYPSVFVVACDMPFLDAALIREMAGRLPGVDAVAIPGEPLHAGYNRSALPALEQALAAGEHAVHQLLGRLRVQFLSEVDLRRYPNWRRALTNVNTPDEWRAVKS